eukprot:5114352-Pyramimonas_sp.AAC.1
MPTQLYIIVSMLLPKPVGGHRPIGMFTGPYRLWGRLRRPFAQAWEVKNFRPWFAAGKCMGASDTVWRQALLSEGGVASG